MKPYEYLPHTADVKFRAFGESIEKCFENAAQAMFASMLKGKLVGKAARRHIQVRGGDDAALLYSFLEELLFLMDTQDFFLKDIQVKISGEKAFVLEAELVGVKASEQDVSIVVKAVTYHEMLVKKEGKIWVAQVVVDV